jgi:DNA-binding MarR family transcriptional regulator
MPVHEAARVTHAVLPVPAGVHLRRRRVKVAAVQGIEKILVNFGRGPIAPTELARLLRFTTGGITTVIDRLERAGYVRRRPEPADRRRLIVEPTDATRDRDRAVFGPLMDAAISLLRPYSQAELHIVAGFLDGMRGVTADCAERLADMAPEAKTAPADRLPPPDGAQSRAAPDGRPDHAEGGAGRPRGARS